MRIFVTPPVKVDTLLNEYSTIIKWKIVVLKKIGNKNLVDQRNAIIFWNEMILSRTYLTTFELVKYLVFST